jgi:hypothetical protein
MGLHKKYNEVTYSVAAENNGFTVLEPYNGITTKIKHVCNKCGSICDRQPRQILKGIDCRTCFQLRVRKPIEQVKQSLLPGNWEILDDAEYKNSYLPLHFKHQCGQIVKSSLEVILRTDEHRKRCSVCTPHKVKKGTWAKPVERNGRKYLSTLEAMCCEYLISKFGLSDIILQKEYLVGDRRTADAYIKSLDTYVEVSSIGKEWYLERIYRKRALVKNFVFVSSFSQLLAMIK